MQRDIIVVFGRLLYAMQQQWQQHHEQQQKKIGALAMRDIHIIAKRVSRA